MGLTKWELMGSANAGYSPSVKCGELPDMTPLENQVRVVNPNNPESPDVEGADE